MSTVTFQVISGLEKGNVYSDLATPITIGREDDNMIRLNDESVSRFHVKIQEDGGRIILTDLDSTNGTRVNGHPVHMRVLRVGDQVAVGRSLLIFGSEEEILQQQYRNELQNSGVLSPDSHTLSLHSDSSAQGENPSTALGDLFPNGPPDIPRDMRAVHAALVSDVLAYLHNQIALILESAEETTEDGRTQMQVPREVWQRLLKTEMHLAVYLRRIAEPDSP